ncbi:hypothetical protein N9E57_02670 [Gammaproteobacteria bacterium]|nr:hypothetical protein [Gammaproteobacteria bacterium]
MSIKKWFYNLGRLSLIFLVLAPILAVMAITLLPSGDGWAQASGPLLAALYLLAGMVILSFITGVLGIFHADRFQGFALISVLVSSALILFVISLMMTS